MRRLGLILLGACPAFAEPLTSAHFLNLPVGARALALSRATTGLSGDWELSYSNPASLKGLGRRQVGYAHTELAFGLRHDALGYAQPWKSSVVGLSLSQLNYGSIEARGADRSQQGKVGAQDRLLQLSYARSLWPEAAMGLNVKFAQSRLADTSAYTVAMDLGVLFSLSPDFRLGASARNMGPGLKYLDRSYPLPLTLTAGMALSLSSLLLTADASLAPHENAKHVGMGVEYNFLPALSLRAGYLASLKDSRFGSLSASDLSGLGLGVGIRLSRCRFDYALGSRSHEGSPAHVLSLGAHF